MEEHSTWLTIEKAMEVSGKGRRTIERLITQQIVTVAKRQDVPGRKPITVIDPVSLTKATAEILRPTVQPAKVPAIPQIRHPDTAAILKALERLLVPPAQKRFLSEREAALYMGLPLSEMKLMTKNNAIPSFRLKNKERRIARADLDVFNPATRQVVEWRNGGIKKLNGHVGIENENMNN